MDCAARLKFMLDIPEHWHDAVHGFLDQGEFTIPLCQRVHPWVERETFAFTQCFKVSTPLQQLDVRVLWVNEACQA